MLPLRDFLRSYHDFRLSDAGLSVCNIPLRDGEGGICGQIERLTRSAGGLRVEGWVDAASVGLTDLAGVVLSETQPDIARPDIRGDQSGTGVPFGFRLKTRATVRRLDLTLMQRGRHWRLQLPTPSRWALLRHRWRIDMGYLRVIARNLPEILTCLRTGDPDLRHRLGAAFRGLDDEQPPLDMSPLDAPVIPGAVEHPITVIMPVYQGLHLLDPALDRLTTNSDLPWHLVVIEDASPDPAVGRKLAQWLETLGKERMTLLKNETNFGFVGSVNRGLEVALARGHDVVLLNSDAFVGPRWASRLLQPMVADRGIASVTPMSNEAEIATVPRISHGIALLPGEADHIDRVAAGLANGFAIATAPTGVGFCMAMSIDMLRRLPSFDTCFGRGYGEEVDWCQRAAALGGRNVVNGAVFVEHSGGESFGNEAKRRLIQQNGAVISRRYPGYDREVQSFIAGDPLRLQRVILGLAFAATRSQSRGETLSVFFGHALGGGAEVYLQHRVAKSIRKAGSAVIIRPLPTGMWKIEIRLDAEERSGNLTALVQNPDDLLRLLDKIGQLNRGMKLVYSCGVGAADPLAIPRLMSHLAARTGSAVELTFNDYFPASPAYTLLGEAGTFSNFPLNPTDSAHIFTSRDGATISLATWQHEWRALAMQAVQLTVFSRSSAQIIGQVWPDLQHLIRVEPHELPVAIPRIAPPPGNALPAIGVLGNINTAKGARVLVELADELARTRRGRLVLIGNLQPGLRLRRPSVVTGSYDPEDLPRLVRKHQVSRWFFPSIWPETFSFATHEMLATGLPVWCFDIGAQADAVRAALARGQKGGTFAMVEGCYDIDRIVTQLTDDCEKRSGIAI